MCLSCDVERVQYNGCVFYKEGKDNGGEGGWKGCIYLSLCDLIVQRILLVNEHKMAPP